MITNELIFEKWAKSGSHHSVYLKGKEVPISGYISIKHILDEDDEQMQDDLHSKVIYHFSNDLSEVIRKHATKDSEEHEY